MKESDNLSRLGIDAGEIGAFVFVIVMAGQGEVLRIIGSTVLLRNNMLDMQAEKWLVVLMDPAVFAPPTRPAPDSLAR